MYSGLTPSFDGLPIAVDVTVPDRYEARGPLVVMMHGFTGDRTTFESVTIHSGPNAAYGPELDDWNNVAFARRGYAVLTYSARGFEASCGPKAAAVQGVRQTLPSACTSRQYWTHVADPKWEIHDAQFLIGTLVDQGLAAPDRIGVTGWSYGAGHSLLLAMYDNVTVNRDGSTSPWRSPRLRIPLHIAASVPLYGWASFVGSVAPNGRATENAFGAHLQRTPVGVPLAAQLLAEVAGENVKRFYARPNQDPTADVNGWSIRFAQGDPYHDDATDPAVPRMLDAMDRRSPLYIAPRGRVPIYMVQGFTDDIFPALQGVQMRNHLLQTSPRYPIKSFFGDVGHLHATNQPDVTSVWHAAGHGFLDYYLKGIGRAPLPDVTVMTNTCGGQARETLVSETWEGLVSGRSSSFAAADNRPQRTTSAATSLSALVSDPVTTEFAQATLLPEPMCLNVPAVTDAATAHWEFPIRKSFVIVGTPTVRARLQIVGRHAQTHVRLWDVAADGLTQTLISHAAYRHSGADPTPRTISFTAGTTAWRLLVGHTLRVELAGSDAPGHFPNKEPATITVDSMTVRLPGAYVLGRGLLQECRDGAVCRKGECPT